MAMLQSEVQSASTADGHAKLVSRLAVAGIAIATLLWVITFLVIALYYEAPPAPSRLGYVVQIVLSVIVFIGWPLAAFLSCAATVTVRRTPQITGWMLLVAGILLAVPLVLPGLPALVASLLTLRRNVRQWPSLAEPSGRLILEPTWISRFRLSMSLDVLRAFIFGLVGTVVMIVASVLFFIVFFVSGL